MQLFALLNNKSHELHLLHTCCKLFVVYHKSMSITAGENNSQAIFVRLAVRTGTQSPKPESIVANE